MNTFITWILWFWATFAAYIKLAEYKFIHFDISAYIDLFLAFMILRKTIFSLLRRVFSLLRKPKKPKQKAQVAENTEQYYYHKYHELLKQQELSNKTKVIDHETRH